MSIRIGAADQSVTDPIVSCSEGWAGGCWADRRRCSLAARHPGGCASHRDVFAVLPDFGFGQRIRFAKDFGLSGLSADNIPASAHNTSSPNRRAISGFRPDCLGHHALQPPGNRLQPRRKPEGQPQIVGAVNHGPSNRRVRE